MKSTYFAFFTGAALLLCAGQAGAHSLLINPPPLTNDDNAKAGPCGCYFGSGPEDPAEDASPAACPASGYKVTDLVPGQTLQVTWKETVNHTGKFRVALSTKPINTVTRADMNNGVLYEAADSNTVSGGVVSATITVPDTPCENCVIQLRQFMEGAATPYYYSCAAINITAPSTSASSSSSASASSTTSGAGGGGGGGGESGVGGFDEGSVGPGPAPAEQTVASGACNVSNGKEGLSPIAGFALLGLFLARARRRASR